MVVSLLGTYFHILEIPIFILITVFGLIHIYKTGFKVNTRKPGLVIAVLAVLFLYISAVILSALNAIELSLVIKSTLKWLLVFWGILFIFLFIETEKRFQFIYWFLFAACFLFILHTFIRIASGEITFLSYRVFPGYESVLSLSLVLPFAGQKKLLTWPVALGSFVAAIMSLSRGAWLAAFATMLFAMFFLHQRIRRYIAGFTLLIILTVIFSPSLHELFNFKWTTVFSAVDASNVERFTLFRIAFKAFASQPLIGIGSLNFPQYIIKEGLFQGLSAEKIDILQPHNTFLQVLAEEGLIGLFFFTFFIFLIFFLVKNLAEFSSIEKRYIYGLQLFFIGMFFNFVLGYVASQFRFFLMLMVGLLISATRLYADKNADDMPKRG